MEIIQFNYKGFELEGKTTGQVRILCPYCSHTRKKNKDKCLAVNIDSGKFFCHNCNVSGNIHSFKNNKIVKKEYVKPQDLPDIKLSQHCIDWFQTRGINKKTIDKMKITSGLEFMPKIEKEVNTIHFNYYQDGELKNIKYRDNDKNFKMFKDAELLFYNIDCLKDANTVIITEGEIDCLSYLEVGYDNVISVPNGANVKLDYLDNCIDYFDNIQHIYIAVDNDAPGTKLRNELVRRLGIERCYKINYQDCKDANEYLLKYGTQALFETINEKNRFPIKGVVKVEDFNDDIDDYYTNGIDKGLNIGLGIDNYIRWQSGRLCIVTGIPSHGKSDFVDMLITLFAIKHNWKSALFSPENLPLPLHFSKLSEKITGKSLDNLTPEEYSVIKGFINEYIYFIKPDDENYTLDAIIESAKQLILIQGIKILVIDPYNTIEFHKPTYESETEFINKQLIRIHNFAQNNDILVFLVAHPRKMEHEKNSSDFKVPTLYDICGSSHFYNKAFYGLTVYRNFKDDLSEVYIQKVKHRHLGNIGMVQFKYNINNGRFTDVELNSIDWDNNNWLVKKPDKYFPIIQEENESYEEF